MATILATYFENIGTGVYATGQAWREFRVRQTLQNGPTETANGYGPNAVYDIVPATTVYGIGISGGSGGPENTDSFSGVWHEYTTPWRAANGSTWPNPFKIVSASVGSFTLQLQSVAAPTGPMSYVLNVTSTGTYEMEEWPGETLYDLPFYAYENPDNTGVNQTQAQAEYELTGGQEDVAAQAKFSLSIGTSPPGVVIPNHGGLPPVL